MAAEVRKPLRPETDPSVDAIFVAALPESDDLALYATAGAVQAARRERRADIFAIINLGPVEALS